MTLDFSKYKHVHFIGIGGIGISAIAQMMLLEGKVVTGSDRDPSEVTQGLEKRGVKIVIGQKAENIEKGTDLVIYTVAIPDDNPELMKAKEMGIVCVTYPQALGALSEQKYTIAISGAHGKTTTTAMIAKVLIDAKMDPTVVVGSFLKTTSPPAPRPAGRGEKSPPSPAKEKGQGDEVTNFIAGKSKYLVAEACEYKRSFLNLSPKILIITNIDDDHLDYYKDIADIKSAFREMAQKVPADGYVICDLEQPHVADVVKNIKATVVDYELFGDMNLELKVPGDHNLSNAAAVLALADALDIPRKSAMKSLQGFAGTWRRFEYKGTTKEGAVVYDDYAHHPTEIKATLAGAREKFPDKRITVVFQPHLFSRTKQHLKEFGKAFSAADNIILAPIYAAREPFDASISSDMVGLEIVKNGGSANAFPTLDAVVMHAKKELSGDKDMLIIMGAGDVYTIADKLINHA